MFPPARVLFFSIFIDNYKNIYFSNLCFVAQIKCPTTSRGLASVGDLVSQMYKLMTELPSTKPTLKFTQNPNCAKPLLADRQTFFQVNFCDSDNSKFCF